VESGGRVRRVAALALASGPAGVLSLSIMRVMNTVPNTDCKPIASPELAPADTRYEPPRYELICLACEISAYAPDTDLPLF